MLVVPVTMQSNSVICPQNGNTTTTRNKKYRRKPLKDHLEKQVHGFVTAIIRSVHQRRLVLSERWVVDDRAMLK